MSRNELLLSRITLVELHVYQVISLYMKRQMMSKSWLKAPSLFYQLMHSQWYSDRVSLL